MMILNNLEVFLHNVSTFKLIMVVLLCSIIALLPAWFNYDIISRDGAFQYVPTAQLFFDGRFHEGFQRPQLPLFPLLIAGVSKVTGFDLETSGRVISAIGFILSAIGLFKLSQIILKDKLATLLSVLFLLSNRKLIECSVDCLKDSLLLSFILWGNYFIFSWISDSQRYKKLISGVLLLMGGIFIRTTSLIFFGAWLVIWLFYKKQNILNRLVIISIPLLCCILLWYKYPDLSLFNKIIHVDYFMYFYSISSVGSILRSWYEIVGTFFSAGNALIVFLGCLGFYFYKKDLYYRHVCIVLTIFFLILNIWGVLSKRYLLAPIIWLYPLSAYTTFLFLRSKNKIIYTIAIIVVISSIISWVDYSLTPPDPYRIAIKESGQWILSQVGPGKDLLTNEDRLEFYAKGNGYLLSSFSNFKDMSKSIAFKSTDGKAISMTDIINQNNVRMPIAIDITEDVGRLIMAKLNSSGIKPDKMFKDLYVYLPKS